MYMKRLTTVLITSFVVIGIFVFSCRKKETIVTTTATLAKTKIKIGTWSSTGNLLTYKADVIREGYKAFYGTYSYPDTVRILQDSNTYELVVNVRDDSAMQIGILHTTLVKETDGYLYMLSGAGTKECKPKSGCIECTSSATYCSCKLEKPTGNTTCHWDYGNSSTNSVNVMIWNYLAERE
jgi:hypothetical protein